MKTLNPIYPPPKPRKKRKLPFIVNFLGWAFSIGTLMVVIGGASAAVYLHNLSRSLPDTRVLRNYAPPIMTRIHANDGRLLAEYARERRVYVPVSVMPQQLINAFLSAEDKNFFKHKGIDPIGIIKALARKYMGGGQLAGASTITQQVAKNFFLTRKRSLERKIKEAILSFRLEKTFSKREILELYLNQIYLGLRAHGVAAASLIYFNKPLNELEVHQMAYLAALPKGPNNYHPFRRKARALRRRNWVLDRMVINGYLSREEAEAAKARDLDVNIRPFGTHIFAANFFAEEVRRELIKLYLPQAAIYREKYPEAYRRETKELIEHYQVFKGKRYEDINPDALARLWAEDKINTSGFSVRTTLDPELQLMARNALIKGLVTYDRTTGWRGPVDKIDLRALEDGDWAKPLMKIKAPNDIAPWRLAVVLDVNKHRAKLGLRPPQLKSGRFGKQRDIGILALEDMKWARPFLRRQGKRNLLGKAPKAVTDTLAVGDVIYAAPADIVYSKKRKKKKTKPPVLAEDEKSLSRWQLVQIPEVGGAMIVMDPHTGRVLALVGGFSYDLSQFNRVTQALRQPGSSFKPFVYAAALDNGYTPATVIYDTPIVIDQGPGKEPWKPQNYSETFYGPSTLRIGIEKSRNLMTVRLAQHFGMPRIAKYAREFGVYDNLKPVLSMSLGAGETTLMRLATGYAILANGGKKVTASLIDRIQDRKGRTIYRHDQRQCPDCRVAETVDWRTQLQFEPELRDIRKSVIGEQTAYQITSMMEGVVQRGTATIVKQVGKPLAGKTGTTNDYKDAWFIGYSPDLVAGVFVGYDEPRSMGRRATGGGLAAPIFKDFMQAALADKPAIPFRVPPGIRFVTINSKTGLRTSPRDPAAIQEAFKDTDEMPRDYDPVLESYQNSPQSEASEGRANSSGWAPWSTNQDLPSVFEDVY